MALRETRLYTRVALGLAIIGIGALVLSWFSYAWNVGWRIADASSSWGEFGDFIGGFAGTIVALATLIALAITLRLQAQALDETKTALADQAKATRDQISLVERAEALKIRPLLKAEWFPGRADDHMEWRVVNIGLGPAVIDRIQIFIGTEKVGEHPMELGPAWVDAWHEAVNHLFSDSMIEGVPKMAATPMNYLKRALGAGEYQMTVGLTLKKASDRPVALAMLNSSLDVVIHFRSMLGEQLSTKTQFP